MSFSPSGTATSTSSAPVEIPKGVKWGKSETLVEAKPSAQIRSDGRKSVLTFVSKANAPGKEGDGDNVQFPLQPGMVRPKGLVDCRIDSIDAPEVPHGSKPGQPYGEAAGKTLEQLIGKEQLTVRIVKSTVPVPVSKANPTGWSNYGRDVCQIEISGGRDLSHEMIKKGAAWLYDKYVNESRSSADVQSLRDELRDAQNKKAGLWANPSPENPAKFRLRNPGGF